MRNNRKCTEKCSKQYWWRWQKTLKLTEWMRDVILPQRFTDTDTSRGLHYNGNKISDFIRFCSVLSTSTRLQGVRWNFRAVVMVSFVAVITKARDYLFLYPWYLSERVNRNPRLWSTKDLRYLFIFRENQLFNVGLVSCFYMKRIRLRMI